MTKRQTQLFALLLLIGAPLLVSLLSGYFLPGIKGISPLATQQPAAPAYMQPAADPAAGLPPGQAEPPAGQTAQSGPQANVAFNAGPAYDPSGTSVQGVDPSADAVMPMAVGGDATAAAPTFNPGGEDSSNPPPESEEGMIARQNGEMRH